MHKFKDLNLKEVIDFLEGEDMENIQEYTGDKEWNEYLNKENQSIFDGFLDLLRENGVRASTPEWLQFLQVVGEKTTAEDLKEMVSTNELLNKVRLFAQTTLVKDKSEEMAFHEAFDEYFELAAKVYNRELKGKEKDDDSQDRPEDKKHDDDENIHGGKDDQHLAKEGGGNKKEGDKGQPSEGK
ncbi:MAG TPA: hypothetical protein EYP59_10130, partial [Thiotrichaceae bacterium]|nr:hypothetical protein [Thiotrichaceae bacterium]